LLLVALVPFERALWDTTRGERISRRLGDAASHLHSGSRRRRMGRLSVIATVALAVSVGLLVTGLQEQVPAHAEAKPVASTKVVRVTRVVRPVTVRKVIERVPVSVAVAPAPQPVVPAPVPPRTTEKPRPNTGKVVVGDTAPVERDSVPKTQPEATPESTQGCESDACGSSAPRASVG
jgi:hypothetical protein